MSKAIKLICIVVIGLCVIKVAVNIFSKDAKALISDKKASPRLLKDEATVGVTDPILDKGVAEKADGNSKIMFDIVGPYLKDRLGIENPTEKMIKDELERLKELNSRTAPHFKELHRKVLEKMITEYDADNDWQKSVEENAQRIMEKYDSVGTAINTINCRTRLCKVVFTHDRIEDLEKFIEQPIDDIPLESGGGIILGGRTNVEDGELGTYVFFSKKGDKLFLYDIATRISEIIEGAV